MSNAQGPNYVDLAKNYNEGNRAYRGHIFHYKSDFLFDLNNPYE